MARIWDSVVTGGAVASEEMAWSDKLKALWWSVNASSKVPHHPPRQHNTLNLPVVARQPHPDPNYASFTAVRRVAGA